MKWCCSTFRDWFEEAGKRGLSIVVDETAGGDPLFFIQHRSVEIGDEGPKDYPRPLTLVGQVGVLFCPWCGASLTRFYRHQMRAMLRPDYRLRQ